MIITPVAVGPFATNSYIVQTEDGCIIIDAPYPAERITGVLKSLGAEPDMIVLTHGHFDHILALPSLKAEYPEVRIAVSAADAVYLSDNGSYIRRDISFFDAEAYFNIDDTYHLPQVDILLKDGDAIPLGFSAISTPGHTEGGMCFYNKDENILFSGDTLFSGSVGRTDTVGGDMMKLIASLKRLMALPEDTIVLPGHGQSTTIGKEKTSNPYIRGF